MPEARTAGAERGAWKLRVENGFVYRGLPFDASKPTGERAGERYYTPATSHDTRARL